VRPDTRYLRTTDGVYIAYQVVGAVSVDVAVDFHHFAGNVDLIWEEPDLAPMLETLARFARVILHDRRGTGASSRNVPPPNLETRAADLLVGRLVLDDHFDVLDARRELRGERFEHFRHESPEFLSSHDAEPTNEATRPSCAAVRHLANRRRDVATRGFR